MWCGHSRFYLKNTAMTRGIELSSKTREKNLHLYYKIGDRVILPDENWGMRNSVVLHKPREKYPWL